MHWHCSSFAGLCVSDVIPVPVCVIRLPEGFTQLLSLTQLYLNDAFLEFLPASFGRSVCSPLWIRMKLFLTEKLMYKLYTQVVDCGIHCMFCVKPHVVIDWAITLTWL